MRIRELDQSRKGRSSQPSFCLGSVSYFPIFVEQWLCNFRRIIFLSIVAGIATVFYFLDLVRVVALRVANVWLTVPLGFEIFLSSCLAACIFFGLEKRVSCMQGLCLAGPHCWVRGKAPESLPYRQPRDGRYHKLWPEGMKREDCLAFSLIHWVFVRVVAACWSFSDTLS